MKATVETAALKKALVKAGKTIPGANSNMDLLKSVKIHANGQGLEVEATDLNTWTRVVVGGTYSHDEGGDEALVDCKALKKLVGCYNQDELNVSIRETEPGSETLQIEEGQLSTMSADEYPVAPTQPTETLGTLDGRTFKDTIRRVAGVALKEGQTTRLALTGVRLEVDDNGLTLIGTDGYRLQKDWFQLGSHEIVSETSVSCKTVIPAIPLKKLAASLSVKDDVTLRISYEYTRKTKWDDERNLDVTTILQSGVGYFVVESGGTEYWFKCLPNEISDNYPDFERVIPDKANAMTPLKFDVGELLKVVERARVFARKDSEAITLNIEPDSSAICVRASSREGGEYEESIRTHGQSPDWDMSIPFSAPYLVDYLKVCKADMITVYLQSPEQAMLAHPTDNESQLFVCMPVLLNA